MVRFILSLNLSPVFYFTHTHTHTQKNNRNASMLEISILLCANSAKKRGIIRLQGVLCWWMGMTKKTRNITHSHKCICVKNVLTVPTSSHFKQNPWNWCKHWKSPALTIDISIKSIILDVCIRLIKCSHIQYSNEWWMMIYGHYLLHSMPIFADGNRDVNRNDCYHFFSQPLFISLAPSLPSSSSFLLLFLLVDKLNVYCATIAHNSFTHPFEFIFFSLSVIDSPGKFHIHTGTLTLLIK